MPKLPLLDLYTDDEGDIAIGFNGDLQGVHDSDVVVQELLWRTKTTPGDWVLQPQCGAGLEDLIGRANTPTTGILLEEKLRDAYTHDGFLTAELAGIQAVPLNREQLVALVQVSFGEESFSYPVTLDLKEGVLT